MSAFEPVSATRLYRMIADQITARIKRGDFPPGTRLPSERDLAVQMSVSRTSVREALIALEIAGYVEVMMGSGVYVCDCARTAEQRAPKSVLRNTGPDIRASGTHPVHADVGPFELLAVNTIVEPEAAAMAATHATAEQREAIVVAERAVIRSETPRLHNRLFHLAIGEATGNVAMALIVRNLWDIHDESVMFNKLEHHIVDHRGAWELAENEHAAIVKAILAGDPAQAKRAMKRHCDGSRRRLGQDFRTSTLL
ncbi:FadR family transcriptional regulator [Methylobacterium sp. E-005]|uniref:FadR/GntR family transcriptional regulator n=1 Tax=Methylobacterium sp. E-005 TaxID=2836549 RepID=UPI001FB8D5A6|nr:FadR/GntR family transcriptional regulator [Methylobacterium sp. E-005]MCJ2088471.1 FadR family transcriptional regulator [Methylobacterium sp. E-005]